MLTPPPRLPLLARRRSLLAMAGALGMLRLARAESARSVVLVFPEIAEPFRGVLARIMDGIDERVGERVARVAVDAQTTPQWLAAELHRQDVRVVVALARQGWNLAAVLENDVAVIGGCVVSIPEAQARSASVFTLAPDPALLFARLRGLLPTVRRVLAVYDPMQNSWLMRLAHDAAKAHGLELVAHEAADLSGALRRYATVTTTLDGRRDALWLPQDTTTVDDADVLTMVLKEAWARRFTVFSSSVAQVRRGALFALYPDNQQMGWAIGSSVLRHLAARKRLAEGVLPLRHVRGAINTRTAAHLGLEPGSASAGYDMVFPAP